MCESVCASLYVRMCAIECVISPIMSVSLSFELPGPGVQYVRLCAIMCAIVR